MPLPLSTNPPTAQIKSKSSLINASDLSKLLPRSLSHQIVAPSTNVLLTPMEGKC